MNSRRLALLVLVLVLGLWACSSGTGSSAGSDVVTAGNLLASEQWWPYRVRLNETLPVAGRDEALPAGMVGVLIRVEPSGLPRIDFGKIGKYELPVESTDILERANAIRTGAEPKSEPNFVQAIKSRMLDSSAETLTELPLEVSTQAAGFLCVFADPAAPIFDALAASLAPLREGNGVLTILFPQGRHDDPGMRDRLIALDWRVPFLHDFLSEPYTRTLLPEGTQFPYVMLQTAEGRVLLQGAWSQDLVAKLDAELGRAFATAPDRTPQS